MRQIFPNTDSNANWSHRGVVTIAKRLWAGLQKALSCSSAATAKGFIVQFSSGAEIEVYDDEIEFD